MHIYSLRFSITGIFTTPLSAAAHVSRNGHFLHTLELERYGFMGSVLSSHALRTVLIQSKALSSHSSYSGVIATGITNSSCAGPQRRRVLLPEGQEADHQDPGGRGHHGSRVLTARVLGQPATGGKGQHDQGRHRRRVRNAEHSDLQRQLLLGRR